MKNESDGTQLMVDDILLKVLPIHPLKFTPIVFVR